MRPCSGLGVFGGILVVLAAFSDQAHAYTEEQVEKGRALWADAQRGRCGECHYIDGENDRMRTPLSGPKALAPKHFNEMIQEYIYWNTAADLVDFIAMEMPRGRPGTLSQPESAALVALILAKNGVPSDGTELTRVNADRIVLDKVLPQRRTPYGLYAAVAAAAAAIAAVVAIVTRRRRA